MENQIKAGDVVVIKSSQGTSLTVEEVDGNIVRCIHVNPNTDEISKVVTTTDVLIIKK